MCSPWNIRSTKETAGVELRIHEGGWGWSRTLFCWDCSLAPEEYESGNELVKSRDRYKDEYISVSGCYSVSAYNVVDLVTHFKEHEIDGEVHPLIYQFLESDLMVTHLRMWWGREREATEYLVRKIYNKQDNMGLYALQAYKDAQAAAKEARPGDQDGRLEDITKVNMNAYFAHNKVCH